MTRHNHNQGFTLIELMLAMAFIGALLVVIAVTSMQVLHTYTKGLTIREVNQAGRTLSDDIQRTVAASTPFTVSPVKTGAPSDLVASRYVQTSGGGRLCVGSYTYVWNYGKTKELSGTTGQPSAYNTYKDSSDIIRFAKVSDPGGILCTDMSEKITKSQARELLAAGDKNLAIQQFNVVEGNRDNVSGQALYAISLTLGTNDQTQLNASGTTCLAPKEGSGGEDFCAINQFDIVVRAGNRSGSI